MFEFELLAKVYTVYMFYFIFWTILVNVSYFTVEFLSLNLLN